ncbi:MAG: DUF2304 domain-containing protein [Lachnospiraceae bacterium]|nr:DUF2304 domain-containing protein [Lachnospiraceae bacterium]
MSLKIQIIIGVIMVIGVLCICNMIRKNKLDLRYGLIWILVGLCVVVLDFCPGLLNFLTDMMGIELPINMLFFLGFCFSLIIIFGLTKTVSELSHKVKRLTQEIALLKEELERED